MYVLAFATLTSVMTGYRAGLTGYFGYHENQDSNMKPLRNLTLATVILYDGTRVGLTSEPFAPPINSSLESTRRDCKLWINLFSRDLAKYRYVLDYIACQEASESGPGTYVCGGIQNKSCIVNATSGPNPQTFRSMINVNNHNWDLDAPALDIRLWDPLLSSSSCSLSANCPQEKLWTYNNRTYDDTTLKDTTRCIASDQYSWGFSSMLLLTFCLYTCLFAMALIALQAEVYWYSQSDRLNLSTSIYADILFLADAMQTRFGKGVWSLSVKELDKKISDHRGGISVDLEPLPRSRMERHMMHRSVGAEHRAEAVMDRELVAMRPDLEEEISHNSQVRLVPKHTATSSTQESVGEASLSQLDREIQSLPIFEFEEVQQISQCAAKPRDSGSTECPEADGQQSFESTQQRTNEA